jgi:hypothetical protein
MFTFGSDDYESRHLLQTKQYPEHILSSSLGALTKQYGIDILRNVPFYPATQKDYEP